MIVGGPRGEETTGTKGLARAEMVVEVDVAPRWTGPLNGGSRAGDGWRWWSTVGSSTVRLRVELDDDTQGFLDLHCTNGGDGQP